MNVSDSTTRTDRKAGAKDAAKPSIDQARHACHEAIAQAVGIADAAPSDHPNANLIRAYRKGLLGLAKQVDGPFCSLALALKEDAKG